MNCLKIVLFIVGASSSIALAQYQPQAVRYSGPAQPLTTSFRKAATPQFAQYSAPAVRGSSPSYAFQPVANAALTVNAAAPKFNTPAYPNQNIQPVAILRQSQDDNFDGSFNYGFETENGISSQAQGQLKIISDKEQAQVIQGVYSYTAPDGTPIVTRWYADETGFHAEGDHLPVAPPVPEAIAKSLAYQASLPPSPIPRPIQTYSPSRPIY